MAMEHWWQCSTNEGWHFYAAYDGLTIEALIKRFRSIWLHPIDFSVISDVELYIYSFDNTDKERLTYTRHFKRCIDP